MTPLVGGRSPREPRGGGGADVPVQGAAAGQLLGLLPANNRETVDQEQLGVVLSPDMNICFPWFSPNDKDKHRLIIYWTEAFTACDH